MTKTTLAVSLASVVWMKLYLLFCQSVATLLSTFVHAVLQYHPSESLPMNRPSDVALLPGIICSPSSDKGPVILSVQHASTLDSSAVDCSVDGRKKKHHGSKSRLGWLVIGPLIGKPFAPARLHRAGCDKMDIIFRQNAAGFVP